MQPEVIDVTTIAAIVKFVGEGEDRKRVIPEWPEPAYQQIMNGVPVCNLTNREMLYISFDNIATKGHIDIDAVDKNLLAVKAAWDAMCALPV